MPAVLCLALLASELAIGSSLRSSRRQAGSNGTAGKPHVMDLVVKNEAPDPPGNPPEDPPEWDDFADGVDQGVGAILDGVALAQDPSLATAGSFLSSVGGLASLAIPPPAGIVVGGVFGLLGGLFGLSAPAEPSNQDILDAMAEGFDKIGARLDNIDSKLERMDRKLDTMQDSLNRIEATTRDIAAIVEAIYGAIKMAPFIEIHGVFQEATNRLQDAAKYPAQQDSIMADFRQYVRQQRTVLAGYAYSHFTPSNIDDILQVIVQNTDGGVRCSAAVLYRDIVAARVELAWILYMGSVFVSDPCPSDGSTCISAPSSRYTEELQEDLQRYEEQILGPFKFERALMQATAAQMYLGDQVPFKALRTSLYNQQAADYGFTPHPADLSPWLLDNEEHIYVRSSKSDGRGEGEACGAPYDNRFFYTTWVGSKGTCPDYYGSGCISALQTVVDLENVCKLTVYVRRDINSAPGCSNFTNYGAGCWHLYLRASMCFHAVE